MKMLKRVLAGGAAAVLAFTGVAVIAPSAAQATGFVYGSISVSPAGPYDGGEIVTISYSGIDSTVSGTTPGNGGGYFIGYCVGSGNPQTGTGACGPFEGGGPFPTPAGPSSTVITGAYYNFTGANVIPNGSVRFQIPAPGANAGFTDYPAYACDNTTQCNITFGDFSGDGPEQIAIAYNEATTTDLTANPSGGSTAGDNVDLTATITPSSATGSVEFFDGATSLGSAAVAAGSATISTSSLPGGTRSLSAEFTGTGVYSDSSDTLSYSVGAAATTTGLSVNNAAPAGFEDVTFTATVAPAAATGSVTFSNGASALCSNVPVSSGTATCTRSFSPNTTPSVTATFTSSSSSYAGSTSSAVGLTVGAAAGALPAEQNVEVTVAPGALTISTDYSIANPFVLPDAVMNADGTAIESSAPFTGGITITDQRAGDEGWTAQAIITDFAGTGSDTIPASSVSLTGVSVRAGSDAAAVPSDVSSLASIATFATAPAGNGAGTTFIDGTLELSAPTTTDAGLYTALLTFTVA